MHIGTLGHDNRSNAHALNNESQVMGESRKIRSKIGGPGQARSIRRSYVWSGGTMTDLAAATESEQDAGIGLSINDWGDIATQYGFLLVPIAP